MEDLMGVITKAAKLKRLQKNISQEKLAELAKISLASVTRFESGRGNISLQHLIAILEVLDMSTAIAALFSDSVEVGASKIKERVKWAKVGNIREQSEKSLDT
jgi:transcriptional regulator with XRE-family HTH domain